MLLTFNVILSERGRIRQRKVNIAAERWALGNWKMKKVHGHEVGTDWEWIKSLNPFCFYPSTCCSVLLIEWCIRKALQHQLCSEDEDASLFTYLQIEFINSVGKGKENESSLDGRSGATSKWGGRESHLTSIGKLPHRDENISSWFTYALHSKAQVLLESFSPIWRRLEK